MGLNRQAGIVFAAGIVLLLAGLWLIGGNEHAAADWHQGMSRHGGDVLVLGPDATPGADLDGRTVLVTGVPKVVEPPRDRDFHVQVDTPLLVRKVAMFQWREVRVGGQVSYEQDWVDHPVDSSRFDQPAGHANTQPFPFKAAQFVAPQVRLDHFMLAPAIVEALPMPVQPVTPDFSRLPANLQASFQTSDGMLTTSTGSGHPRLGDLRVHWLAMPLDTVTVVARVDGDRLAPAKGATDDQGFQVQLGQRSLTDIFADLPLPPDAVWAWRVVALLLAWAGAWLIVRHWCSPRSSAPTALASGVAVLALLAGIMWLTASVAVAIVAWAITALAAATCWFCWRRPA
ncbi:MAG TPA: TMEM43 family protein [Rhodanobacteraceae bacterium]|nr:TMEM43 family protein [Rhodanobacteraceae bacterium]